MRLVSYRVSGSGSDWRAGIQVGEQVVDAVRAAGAAGDESVPASVRGLVGLEPSRLAALRDAAAALVADGDGSQNGIELGPPIPDPDKILCIGLNYREHAEETKLEAPPAPTVFAKFRNSLVGPGADIVIPPSTSEVDYEGELAVVIGRRCSRVDVDDAVSYVAGVTALNDVSARDLQMQTPQWTVGKAVDTFAPCGPALVLLDEIDDVQSLELETRLNGDVVQHASTALMIFGVAEIIAFLSRTMTLEPGDIIATGTPAGVGFTREPPLFMRPGDTVEVEIGGVGTLANTVRAET